MNRRPKTNVLFVCMGNICRSPLAEGVFRQRLTMRACDAQIEIDSAGTHGYHVGAPPDERAQAAATRRGVDVSSLAARSVIADDFDRFDYILAMDKENLEYLHDKAGKKSHARIQLFLDYSAINKGADVPDPYYGGPIGFERVLDLIDEATEGLLDEVIDATTKRSG